MLRIVDGNTTYDVWNERKHKLRLDYSEIFKENPQDEIETRGIVFCRSLERILGIISKTNRVEELPMPMYPNTKGLRIHVIVKLKCTNAANRLSILAN
jgi:hypothetical protein